MLLNFLNNFIVLDFLNNFMMVFNVLHQSPTEFRYVLSIQPPLPILYIIPTDSFTIITTLYGENIKLVYQLPIDVFSNMIYIKNIDMVDGITILQPWKDTICIPNVSESVIQNVADLHVVVVENFYLIRFESSGRVYTLITSLPPENFINLQSYTNVSITPLHNFALIYKSELKAILPYLDMPKIYKLDFDCYRAFTSVSKSLIS